MPVAKTCTRTAMHRAAGAADLQRYPAGEDCPVCGARVRNPQAQKDGRAAALERDGYHCRWDGCTMTTGLAAAHIIPLAKGGSYDASNLLTLCTGHHLTFDRLPLADRAQSHPSYTPPPTTPDPPDPSRYLGG